MRKVEIDVLPQAYAYWGAGRYSAPWPAHAYPAEGGQIALIGIVRIAPIVVVAGGGSLLMRKNLFGFAERNEVSRLRRLGGGVGGKQEIAPAISL